VSNQRATEDKLLSSTEVAAELSVSRQTVVRWVNSGIIDATVLPSGIIRISAATVASIKNNRTAKTD
jgi:excisionase family DNA binding protein